jgi:hypothetical protein
MITYRSLYPAAILVAAAGALALAIFFNTGNDVAGWSFAAAAIGLPTLIGLAEQDRRPNRPIWLAPLLTVVLIMLIVFTLAVYAISRI